MPHGPDAGAPRGPQDRTRPSGLGDDNRRPAAWTHNSSVRIVARPALTKAGMPIMGKIVWSLAAKRIAWQGDEELGPPMPGREVLYAGTLPPFPGGTAVLCAQLLRGLVERGHRVRAFAPSTETAERRPHPFATSHPNLSVTKFFLPRHPVNSVAPMDKSILDSMRRHTLASLTRAMEEEPADVVLIGRESFLWGVPALARSHETPCIQIAHAEASALAYGNFGQRFAGRLVDEMAKVDRVVAVADHLAERLRSCGLGNVTTIPNPVDVERFAPAQRDTALMREMRIPEGAIVIMHVSNPKPVKRIPDILASAARATASDGRLCYVLVGCDDEATRSEAARAGVVEHCRFTPWVDHAEVHRYLRLADIVLMPSQTEAMALAYLEAQASASVLIASDIPAAREVVTPGETGLLHPIGDVAALTEQTLRAAQDAALRRRIAMDARRQVVQRNALGTVVAAYEALIDACAARRAL